jgi:holin (3TMs family)
MSLLDTILPSFLNPVATAVSTVVDRLVPDVNAAQKLKDDIALELNKAQIAGQLAQIDVDKVEAANTNVFVSGWRPFVGWTCGFGLACQFVLGPILTWLSTLFGHPVVFPQLPIELLITLLLGMLGLSTQRTVEKAMGVAT